MFSRKFYITFSFALMIGLAGNTNAATVYNYLWTNASGDGMWNNSANWQRSPSWMSPASWSNTTVLPEELTEDTSGQIWLTPGSPNPDVTDIPRNPSLRLMPVTIPAGYDADCGSKADLYQTILGPEGGMHLDIYGKLSFRWTIAPVQTQEGLLDANDPNDLLPPDDPNRTVINLFDGSEIYGPWESEGALGGNRCETICLGLSWWYALPYVTMNMYGDSAVYTLSLHLGGHLNMYGGTMDITDYVLVGTRDTYTVADELIRIDIYEGKLILPANFADAVQDWINRGILKAYGMTPGEPKGAQIIIDTTTIPDRTIVTALSQSPPEASMPEPSDGATDVRTDTNLSWRIGYDAAQHDVYFGTNADDINDVNSTNLADYPNVTYDNLTVNSFSPGILDMNTTYCWRVDEVNDAHPDMLWKGDVWSFTTLNFYVVEDFEDYNDYEPDTVWNTWKDGYGNPTNGSTAGYPNPDFVGGEHYLEDVIVHTGDWSMPLLYDNSVGLSEVTRILNTDWTFDNIVTLTLFYYGNAENTPEPMFVAIDDAVVTNDDTNAALVTEWTQWDIPLQLFVDQGVNLTSVGSITIGFGNKTNPIAGGSGQVFFDDIRLYRP